MTSLYSAGTISLTNGSPVITGIGTAWAVELITGGTVYVQAEGNPLPIATVVSDTEITAALAWTGATGTYAYALRRDERDQNARNAEVLTRLLAGMEAGTIFKYNAEGDTAGRAFYDGRPKGFSYLEFAEPDAWLWVKASNADGDWAGPFAYGRGETGPSPALTFSPVVTGAPGTPASMITTGAGPYNLAFTIPAGLTGMRPRGAYDAGTSYLERDSVRDNGSTWIAKQDTIGNAPPVLPAAENAFWELVAAKGLDGSGTGDMIGPASAVDGRLAVFDGTTGKLLKDGGAPFTLPGRLGPQSADVGDWNLAIENGWHRSTPGAFNSPDGAVYWCGLVQNWNNAWVRQTVWSLGASAGDTITWQRDFTAGEAWGAWYPVLSSQAELDARYASPELLRGYLSGLTLSNSVSTPNTQIEVAAGVANSSDNDMLMQLTGGMINCATVGANGLDAGALTADTWYHAFAIGKADGTTARLASLSPVAPTLPSGYVKKRRLGSFRTNASSQIIPFKQMGNKFLWVTPRNDYIGNNPGTAAITPELSVPAGVQVDAYIWFFLRSEESTPIRRTALITSLDQADTVPSAGVMSSIAAGTVTISGITQAEYQVRTNTGRQVRFRLDGSGPNTSVFINTTGWIDYL